MSEMLEIDGSILEGGGQILRNSVSLSAILGVPVRVTKIRTGRSKPGLAAQHLKGIQLVGQMCQAKLHGAHIGSTEIEFMPGKLRGGNYIADTHTAGSISLLLQVALPCALLADGPVTLVLKGGTNADMAPQIDYITEVFRHVLKKFGADFHLTIHRRGYFPKGGGHVTVKINPVRQLKSVDITERGTVQRIQGWSFVAGTLPIKMAYQMADGAKYELRDEGEVSIECYKEHRNFAPDNCCGIILVGSLSGGAVLGSDGLCGRGAAPGDVGGAAPGDVGGAAGRLLRALLRAGVCLDAHAQDQVIMYMALAAGVSAVRVGEVTLHTKTAIYIAELITKVKFNIKAEGDVNVIECNGLGFTNNQQQ